MNAIRQLGFIALTLTSLLLCRVSDASIMINGTRFIYNASDKEVTVVVLNKAKRSVLMKAWTDTGDESSKADSIKTPFIITPPLVRIDGDKEQTYRLRLVDGADSLPKDRESVFWINLLEVPPKIASAEDSQRSESKDTIQLAFQYRLKIFYRPSDMPGKPEEAAEKLRWVMSNDDQGKPHIKAINESSYHVSLSKIVVSVEGRELQLRPEMVAPRSSQSFDLPQNVSGSKLAVSYQWIDDGGGLHNRDTAIGG